MMLSRSSSTSSASDGTRSPRPVRTAPYCVERFEFEAVFLVGVDRLAVDEPDLFHQALYVGSTRATRYLGLTCDKVLPPSVEHLRPSFGAEWAA